MFSLLRNLAQTASSSKHGHRSSNHTSTRTKAGVQGMMPALNNPGFVTNNLQKQQISPVLSLFAGGVAGGVEAATTVSSSLLCDT
jgi:hypothetical protein